LVPSRTHIKQYQRYLEEVDSLISEINQTFGTSGWEPISVFYENNYTQAIAAMKLYDVLIVNPTIDGMNLVAKEGPIVNTKNGLLILSETTGAHHQLKNGVISVSPTDVEGTSQALYQAITATMTEREKQTAELIDKIEKEDIITWLQWQINDIKDVISRVG
jgi:trehalose 6-phosphate synthase